MFFLLLFFPPNLKNIEAIEMAQQKKALGVKPHNLSSIPGIYMVEGEMTPPAGCVLTSVHLHR